jgi:hypothetical protein
MWKACGITCVDGVLYMGVSRQLTCPTEPKLTWQGRYSPFPIQETWDSSIISSPDHGRTWSSAPELGHSMFPGRTFSTPFFVQYGKDVKGQDESDSYVYAVSNDGAWNNGNWMTLGRVPRNRIARLDAKDWEFTHHSTTNSSLFGNRTIRDLSMFFAPQGEPVWRVFTTSPHSVAISCLSGITRAWMIPVACGTPRVGISTKLPNRGVLGPSSTLRISSRRVGTIRRFLPSSLTVMVRRFGLYSWQFHTPRAASLWPLDDSNDTGDRLNASATESAKIGLSDAAFFRSRMRAFRDKSEIRRYLFDVNVKKRFVLRRRVT